MNMFRAVSFVNTCKMPIVTRFPNDILVRSLVDKNNLEVETCTYISNVQRTTPRIDARALQWLDLCRLPFA